MSEVPFHSLVAQLVKNLPAMQETQVRFLGQEDPLEKAMAIHSSILAWRIAWTEEPGGLAKSRTRLSDLHIACQPPVTLPLELTCILRHIPSSTCKAGIKLF